MLFRSGAADQYIAIWCYTSIAFIPGLVLTLVDDWKGTRSAAYHQIIKTMFFLVLINNFIYMWEMSKSLLILNLKLNYTPQTHYTYVM